MSRFVLLVVLIVLLYRLLPRLWRGVLAGISGGTPHGTPNRQGSKPAVQMVRDPVCGTFVVPERSVTLSLGSRQLHFCSTTCRDTYRARPS